MAGTAGCQQVSFEQLFAVTYSCHENQALGNTSLIDSLDSGKIYPLSLTYMGMWDHPQIQGRIENIL